MRSAEPSSVVVSALSERVTQSEQQGLWVQSMVDGLTVSFPSTDNRLQFAAACWATAIEGHHAIVLLTRAGCHGSARALLRPLFEGYIRGVWLQIAASDHEVDVASQDRFPAFGRMVEAIEMMGPVTGGRLPELKAAWWGPMCSLTHTTLQQIGTPLTPTGGGAGQDSAEMIDVLTWADWTVIQAVRGLGIVAGDGELVRAADERVRGVFGSALRLAASGP